MNEGGQQMLDEMYKDNQLAADEWLPRSNITL
jgi:hypothetical protein